jgi:hypothetical protein
VRRAAPRGGSAPRLNQRREPWQFNINQLFTPDT